MMPFKQANTPCGGASIPQYRLERKEDGSVVKILDNRKLPPADTFSTKNMLRAGQDLGQPVNPIYRVTIGDAHQEKEEV